ncbi:MAG: hypothetical protein AAFU03_02810, partial [Bacteroidota bacterium]
GCVGDQTVEVELEDNAVVAVLPDSLFLNCITGLGTIDRSNSTPAVSTTWLRDGVEVFLPGQNPIVNVPGTYTLILGNIDGSCTDTAFIEVVADCPILSIIIPPDSLTCDNTQVLLDASPSIPSDPNEVTVEWLIPNPACAVPGATEREILVACPGNYGFVINNILEGTSDTSFVEVTQDLRAPEVEAGPNDTITCYVPLVTLDAAASEQDPRYEYVWTNAGDDTLAVGQIATTNEPGIYLLRVMNRETGCNATDVVTIFRDNAVPDLSFADAFIPCMEDSFRLEVFTNPMEGDYAYAWNGPLVQADGDSAEVIIGAEGTYTATVTNLENGCPTSSSTFAEQLPCPPCLILSDTALTCASNSVLLDVAFCEPCQGCSFTWFQNGEEIVGENTSMLAVTEAGVYRLASVNIFGLSSDVTITVTDNRVLPEAPAGPDQFLTCDSTSVLLGSEVIDSIFGFTYQWLDPLGMPIPGATTTYLQVDTPGEYVLSVFNPLSDCQGLDTVLVTYDTLAPIAEAGPDRLLTCEDRLGVLLPAGTSTGSAFEYEWTGGPSVTCLEGITTLSPIVACGGTYVLQVRNRLNGCISYDSTVVLADDALPEIIPLADTNLTCALDSLELIPFMEDPSFISTWCLENEVGDTIPGSCQNTDNLWVTDPGTYRYTVLNPQSGCTNFFDVGIGTDFRNPLADAGESDTLYCTLDSLALMGAGSTQSGEDPLFNWVSEIGFPVSGPDAALAYAFQPDRYILTVTDPFNGCMTADTVELFRDIAAPIAEAGVDTMLNCRRRQIRLEGSGQTLSGQATYDWTTPDGNIISGDRSLTPLVDAAGTYFLAVTDPVNNCSSQDLVTVGEDTIRPEAILAGLDSLLINCFQPSLVLDASASNSGTGAPFVFNWRTQGVGTPIDDEISETVTVDAAGSYLLFVTDLINQCVDTLPITVNSDFTSPNLRLTNPPSLTCDTTEVTLSASPAIPPAAYRYRWLDSGGDTLSFTS